MSPGKGGLLMTRARERHLSTVTAAVSSNRLDVQEAESLARPDDAEEQEGNPRDCSKHCASPHRGEDENAERNQGQKKNNRDVHGRTLAAAGRLSADHR